jgi:hypothetical protein
MKGRGGGKGVMMMRLSEGERKREQAEGLETDKLKGFNCVFTDKSRLRNRVHT